MKRMKWKLVVVFCGVILSAALAVAIQSLDDLAERGESLSKNDPLSMELSKREITDLSRRGFYIGLAVAEGHTAPGPGKDAARARLNPREQSGFDRGVLFSLDRNRHTDLAKVGAAIAKADPKIGAARTADPDVFFWLGFDIATGIFGDPKLGAKGNTATGPGSLKIRDGLGAGAQRGFNAAVKLLVKPAPGRVDPNAVVSHVAISGSSSVIRETLKLPFISDIRVVPDSRNVVISFLSSQSTPPLIEIGRVAPTAQGPILGFAPGNGAFARFVPLKKNRYTLDLDVLGEQLAVGTTYYYIINVFNDVKGDKKRPRDQITGHFTTLPQTIKVVFDEIFIDWDILSPYHTDYVFQFDVMAPGAKELGPREPWYSSKVTGRRTLGTANKPLKLMRGVNKVEGFEIVLEYAPDALQLSVLGHVPNLDYVSQGIVRQDTLFRNTASGSFDLSLNLADRYSLPFTLTSAPPSKLNNGRISRGQLQFKISGRIEVTRNRP